MTRIPGKRNRLGPLAIVLAAVSVGSYLAGVVWNNHVMANPEDPADRLSSLGVTASMLAAGASAVIGIAAVVRAQRGSGSLVVAIAGLAFGGVLTAMFAIWFLGLMLDPGALG